MTEEFESEEAKKSFIDFMTDPDRNYCEGRFLSVAAELVRMGHKPRIVAQAGLNVGIEQALDESMEYYDQFMQRLGEMSARAAARLALEIEEAEAAEAAGKAAMPGKPVRY